MADILASEREKMITNAVIKLIRNRLDKKKEDIHKLVINSKNPVVQDILSRTRKAGNNINARKKGDKWQRRNMYEKVELALWIMLTHKKYNKLLEPIAKNICKKECILDKDAGKMKFLDSTIVDMCIKYAYKELKKGFTFDMLINETESGSNPACFDLQNRLQNVIIDSPDFDKDEKKMFYDLIALGIWFCQHDTAYRDIFFWIVYHIGNDEVKQIVKPYYLPPSKWYINLYLLGMQQSREMRANGEIGMYQHSPLGEMSVPGRRKKHLEDIIEKKLQ